MEEKRSEMSVESAIIILTLPPFWRLNGAIMSERGGTPREGKGTRKSGGESDRVEGVRKRDGRGEGKGVYKGKDVQGGREAWRVRRRGETERQGRGTTVSREDVMCRAQGAGQGRGDLSSKMRALAAMVVRMRENSDTWPKTHSIGARASKGRGQTWRRGARPGRARDGERRRDVREGVGERETGRQTVA